VKWTGKKYLNARFGASRPKYSPTLFWPKLARFPGTWRIFSSPGDSKLTPAGLGFQWKGQRKNIWTLSFELLGRNITPFHFKTERMAETALRAGWFWPALARFPGIWWIFSSPGDSKLTLDRLGFRWNGQRRNNWTLGFELLGRNIVPVHLKTEKVAQTALRVAWFWPTLAGVPRTWVIFSSPGDS